MTKAIDISGVRYGKLVAVRRTDQKKHSTFIWECLCDCGKQHFTSLNNLRNGHTKSCGCLKLQQESRRLDITGEVYGQLTAIKNTFKQNNNGCYIWEFSCSCGNIIEREIGNLRFRREGAKCGSCNSKASSLRNTTHGTPKSDKIYKAWCKIKERCFNPNDKSYPDYGAKGITMQEDWINDFIKFRDYIGEQPNDGQRYSVDRIDNSKGYQEGNIRWATYFQQARNKTKSSANKSGVTGVRFEDKKWPNSEGSTRYAVAQWKGLNGEPHKKCFSFKKYGEELAFFLACEYREQMIALLNLQGAGYSENHGK